MNERSGSEWNDPNLFDVINDAYDLIFTKKAFKNNYIFDK